MARRIFIVGGLLNTKSAGPLLKLLRERTASEVEWEWIFAPPPNFSVGRDQRKPFNRLVFAPKRAGAGQEPFDVLKLPCLHGRDANKLLESCLDPILVPSNVVEEDQFFEWIFAADSGVFPSREWFGNACEAALMAIVAKLIRNKSVNKDQRGHNWTKEEDLLNQAPVSNPNYPKIREEAILLLGSLRGNLLLTKGANQGNTPKEWCVNTQFLPYLKKAILSNSLTPLGECERIASTMVQVQGDNDRCYRMDGVIISEKVLYFCRGRE